MLTTIKTAATAMTATGGTAATIAWMGRVGATVKGYFAGDTTLKSRRTIVAKVREPAAAPGSPGGMSMARRYATINVPVTITENGQSRVALNRLNIELVSDAASDVAGVLELRMLGSQFLADPTNDAFFNQLAI